MPEEQSSEEQCQSERWRHAASIEESKRRRQGRGPKALGLAEGSLEVLRGVVELTGGAIASGEDTARERVRRITVYKVVGYEAGVGANRTPLGLGIVEDAEVLLTIEVVKEEKKVTSDIHCERAGTIRKIRSSS